MTKLRMAILIASSLIPTACSAQERVNNSHETTVQRGSDRKEQTMQIRIRAGKNSLTARLEDSPAARDFAAMLPLRLSLKDYASTEKIAGLPRKLSTEGAPAGIDPSSGDITYYKPWGNLAVFYRDGHHSPGLVRLGRIESGAEALVGLEGPITIEAVEQ